MKIALSIVLAGLMISSALLFSRNRGAGPADALEGNNVTVVDGKQVIDIRAKGRYSPQETVAQADMPTVLKVATNGTFDCTSAITIPSLNYTANLPPSGVTSIDVPPQKKGSTLQGSCEMGMYHFSIAFN